MPKILRKRSFDRTVVKKCPKCDQQVPVACKYCPCGHQFSKKLGTPGSDTPSFSAEEEQQQSVVKIRRTERTRRERPDFFNPMMLEDQQKRARKRSQNSISTELPVETPKKGRGRGRPKGALSKPMPVELHVEPEKEEKSECKPAVVEEDVFVNLTPEKKIQFSFILDELNRKFATQNFKPL